MTRRGTAKPLSRSTSKLRKIRPWRARPSKAMLDRVQPAPAVRDAVLALAGMRELPPANASRDVRITDATRTQIFELSRSGDQSVALAKAREILNHSSDEPLRELAEQLAREDRRGSGRTRAGLITRLDRVLDNAQRRPLILRTADLLNGPLDRPEDARRRLEFCSCSASPTTTISCEPFTT